MDPVTHLASGALAAQFSRRWIPRSRALWPFCLIASVLPDIDHFTGLWSGPQAYLLDHRGVTHSVFGALGLSLLLAGAFRACSRDMRLAITIPLGCFLLGVHIFLDLITSYGTQLLAPLSEHRYSLDAVFIIDPFFTLTLLAFVLFARLAKEAGVVFAAAGLLWLFAYPMTNLGVREAVQRTADYRAKAAAPSAWAESLPAPLSPVFWKVVEDNGTDYSATTANVLAPEERYPVHTLPKADPALLRRLGRQAPLFSTFAWFARFPYMIEEPAQEGRILRFGDVRFTPVTPLMKALGRGEPQTFRIMAVVDKNGRLIRYTYKGKDFTPTAPAKTSAEP
ncbi:MAG: metal-dependent hydrolase [Desulfovibrionaceae bacterium]